MPNEPTTARRSARTQARLGAGMLWLGLLVSLGLTLVSTFAWGISATSLRSQRNEGVPDEQLVDLIARTEFLAGASLWVALGAVPLGLALIVVGLAIRGRANRTLRGASKHG
jgi:hypothetical protein